LGRILFSSSSKTKVLQKLVIMAVCFPLGLVLIGNILGRTTNSIGISELLARELSFPFASYIVHLDRFDYRFFKDIIVAPLFVLPQRIWGNILNIETPSSFNTYVFRGARKGEAGITGEIPVDMLTFAHMQASIFGVVIVGLLWGMALYVLEKYCFKLKPNGVRSVIYSHLILDVCILTVLYGDPQHLIVRNFSMIIGLFLLNLIIKIRLFKRSKSLQ
jgi:hypothetical protein